MNAGSATGTKSSKVTEIQAAASKEIPTRATATSLQDVWESLKAFLLALGDDVTMKELEHYIAFRRIKNFACVKILHSELQIWAKVDPANVELQDGFTRDVTNVGHLGTGNLEIRIESAVALEKAKALLLRSYQQA